MAPVLCLPLGGLVPLQAPDALQALASVEAQARVADPPTATVPAPADSVTVGARITVTVVCETVEPPVPLHTNE